MFMAWTFGGFDGQLRFSGQSSGQMDWT